MRSHTLRRSLLAAAAALAVVIPLAAQQERTPAPRALTSADYARAERFMTYNTTPLLRRSVGRATWLPDDRVWYRVTTDTGSEAVLIDPAKKTRVPCDLPACRESAATPGGGRGGVPQRTDIPSPDGKRTAFVREAAIGRRQRWNAIVVSR